MKRKDAVRAGAMSYVAEIVATPWWSDEEKMRRVRATITKANEQGAEFVSEHVRPLHSPFRVEMPVHEHDCDRCTFIGSYRLRHPYTDDRPGYEGYRTGVPGKVVTMGDVYLSCEQSGYRYIVRYGIHGEYATTNVAAHYVLAPMVDGTDPYA